MNRSVEILNFALPTLAIFLLNCGMEAKKSYVPLKLFVAYSLFAALVTGVAITLIKENTAFSETERNIATDNNKILKINSFVSNVYKVESFSRITIQSESQEDHDKFVAQSDSLVGQIDELKQMVNSAHQVRLLDSVKYLISTKVSNINQLREIKNKAGDEAKVTKAIADLTRMEQTLRKLRLEDFVEDPRALGAYQRRVMEDYVAYLNQNIPDDETNTLSQKVLDSMLVASRQLLNDVRQETINKNRLLNQQESKLLETELSISAKLTAILSEIEEDLRQNSTLNNQAKTQALNKIIRIITWAAVIGLVLALIFSMLILNDFWRTKKYKKQLEIANARASQLLVNREQLISTVSHDLKTPLSTITGYTEMLSSGELSARQQYYTRNIKGASEYISHLVQDLFDFTQIEAGKITIEKIPFSVADVIDDVTRSINPAHLAKPIELGIDVANNLQQPIIGDPFRLRQILTNLVGNAYKFTDSGTITITANQSSDGTFMISVADSGIGIADEKKSVIFEEFTQADETIEKRFGGTGLGLTISKKMAEILGGTLKVSSVLGKGSTFMLELPLIFSKKDAGNTTNFTNMIVVAIDDDQALLNLTTETFKQHGFTTFAFTDATQALQKLETIACDIIVTDIQMPALNGFEFAKTLRQTTWFKANPIPIIAVTGKSDSTETEFKECGFATVIRKPFTPKTLIASVGRVLQTEIDSASVEISDANSAVDRLRQFYPNDEQSMQKFIVNFIANTQANMTELERAVESNDETGVRNLAHRMAPMFQQLGCDKAGENLKAIEKDGFSADVQKLVSETKVEVGVLLDELSAYSKP